MLNEFLPLTAYAALALFIGVAAIALSSLLGPRRTYSKAKYDPYECGVDALGDPHRPFAVKFYTFALMFILFDIETIFLIPFAVGYRDMLGTGALSAVLAFLAVLGLGLVYIIRTGALEWE
jgi:NADH-quinone oxidoreductase subunit A